MKFLQDYLPVLILAALTNLSALAWWFMARRHSQWSAWVDRENDFWLRKGLTSPALAERIKKIEKGPFPKILAALATCLGFVALVIVLVTMVRIALLQHQQLKLPYNPALAQKPVKPPLPKPPVRRPATNPPVKAH